MPKRASTATTLRPISANECYPLDVFAAAAGLGRAALREARRNGLKVRRVHGRAYVFGSDWLDYLRKADGDENNTNSNNA